MLAKQRAFGHTRRVKILRQIARPAVPALAALTLQAAASEGRPDVYVIPVEGMIERALVYVVRRGVAQALANNAAAIVLDMDTPGGRLDAAEEIVRIVGHCRLPTFTYVNVNAISAGAILALATDRIYMAPGSRIGDAMPILMSPMGGAREMPESVEEKAVSYVASLIRSVAQENNHDPQLAEAMVRREVEYAIGDDVISPAGQLLTLTNQEAERLVNDGSGERRLLSEGTIDSLEALLERHGLSDAVVHTVVVTPAERIARYIETFSFLFLAAGLLGVYIEFRTPGFGIPGLLGLLSLAIWFWGYHIAGMAGAAELALFVVGVTLLAVELFLIPGFGVTGVAGIACVLAALLMSMVQTYPGIPWYRPPAAHVQSAVRALGGALVIAFAGAAALSRFLPRTAFFQHLSLATSVSGAAGYRAGSETETLPAGERGLAVTDLRPAGIAQFADRRLSVVAGGTFIERGTHIVVADNRGNRIVVEPVAERALPTGNAG